MKVARQVTAWDAQKDRPRPSGTVGFARYNGILRPKETYRHRQITPSLRDGTCFSTYSRQLTAWLPSLCPSGTNSLVHKTPTGFLSGLINHLVNSNDMNFHALIQTV
jgi:hypothetical protein